MYSSSVDSAYLIVIPYAYIYAIGDMTSAYAASNISGTRADSINVLLVIRCRKIFHRDLPSFVNGTWLSFVASSYAIKKLATSLSKSIGLSQKHLQIEEFSWLQIKFVNSRGWHYLTVDLLEIYPTVSVHMLELDSAMFFFPTQMTRIVISFGSASIQTLQIHSFLNNHCIPSSNHQIF